MSTFVVILDREGAAVAPQVEERLKEAFPVVHAWLPTVFLVSSDGLTSEVAEAGGINGEGDEPRATGAVFRIDNYSGFSNRSLWEWLGKAGT